MSRWACLPGLAVAARSRVFESVPARLAWILEEDRRVAIPIPDREASSFDFVMPDFAHQEGTNVVR